MNEENMNEMQESTTTEIVENKERTFTETEVMKLVDKQVKAALKKQGADYDKKLSLSKLDENQRAVAEKESRIAELEEQLKEFEVEKNRSEIMRVLSARSLSPEFADLIQIGEDLEEAQARIDTLDRLFKSAVAAEVKARLATNNPKVGTGVSDELTSDSFKKLSLIERNKLYQSDPEKFRKLMGQ